MQLANPIMTPPSQRDLPLNKSKRRFHGGALRGGNFASQGCIADCIQNRHAFRGRQSDIDAQHPAFAKGLFDKPVAFGIAAFAQSVEDDGIDGRSLRDAETFIAAQPHAASFGIGLIIGRGLRRVVAGAMDDAERSDHRKSLLKEASHLDHAEIEVPEMDERFFDRRSEGPCVPDSFQLIVRTKLKHGTLTSRQLSQNLPRSL